jgi:predicted amidophosphoribosyltransferase
MTGLAPEEHRCLVCDREYDEGQTACHNPVCNWPDRQFEWNYAVALKDGPLEQAIYRYKFDDVRAWAAIFGRVHLGFLDLNRQIFGSFDLMVASPTFVGRGGRSFDHTRAVVEQAARESVPGRWPFDLTDPAAITKVQAAKPLMRQKSMADRRLVAQTELRDSLRVPDPSRTAGVRILIYDDVFTTGLTLNEVARALRMQGGATSVCGVSLARAKYRGSRAPLPTPF